MPRQFQWINANGYPVLYTTDGITSGEAAELRNAYDRMQYGGVAAQNGMLESTTQSSPAYPQYIQQQQQQGQEIAATVSSPSYMTALPATTLMHVNSGVNYTTANNAGAMAATTFTDAGAMRSVVPLTKMPYATATLGRPPRHPGLKGSEPSICAQVSQIQRYSGVPRGTPCSTKDRDSPHTLVSTLLLLVRVDRFGTPPSELNERPSCAGSVTDSDANGDVPASTAANVCFWFAGDERRRWGRVTGWRRRNSAHRQQSSH